ncbi:FlaD/FlaE family flagellar protein [Salinirussus salinus]|uniref:FlaD/FlaE family flagellar protein n=1 Tax=Salinirussus salinus TaxID=1198300 RepID=UPI001359A7A3|nr:FlaD/FlaE family flagellar protein [Salinirussus salinus]
MGDADHTRPYLDGPVDTDRAETLIQWAKYLGTTFGTSGALCALRYYERLGWLTPAARVEVEQQLQGLSIEEIHSKKYDEPGHLTGPLASLSGTPFGAHAKSLEFIANLAGADLEGDILRTELAKNRAGVDLPDPSSGGATPVPSGE